MEDKKYTIFISSTFKDLIEVRENLMKTILRMYHFPIGMELFSAGNDEQWKVIQKTINMTDYYVLILGHRYGSVDETGIGYTEKEYNYAKSLGIPILSFIRNEEVATKPNERENDATQIDKLNKFREKAMKNKMCEFWSYKTELAEKVAIALMKQFQENPGIGWVRGDKAISSDIVNEITLLNKENRALKKELEEIKTKTIERIPIIELEINNSSELEIDYKKIEMEEYPSKLDIDSILPDLKNYIKTEEVNKYNSIIESREIVENYFNELNKFRRIKENNCELSFSVINNGNIKATNIIIDIVFPEEVLVFEKEKIDEYEEPENPIPENPIVIAKRRMKSATQRMQNSITTVFHDYGNISKNIPFINTNKNKWRWVEGNNVTLKINSLIHTRKTNFDKGDSIYVVPIKTGEYAIEVEIICEEMPEKSIIEIPLRIK